VERCEEALVSYRGSPRVAATLDPEYFADGLAVRQARLDAALVAVHQFATGFNRQTYRRPKH
jgi:hypothetical protein